MIILCNLMSLAINGHGNQFFPHQFCIFPNVSCKYQVQKLKRRKKQKKINKYCEEIKRFLALFHRTSDWGRSKIGKEREHPKKTNFQKSNISAILLFSQFHIIMNLIQMNSISDSIYYSKSTNFTIVFSLHCC